ncbi:LPXTG cell wall anchor domain-containing protein [Candidatus Saccharibacteria bacterium]|nr:LPXTG cell wall anchor domain-containing protein [Candidatus Saccharibacteria bacterium]
MKTVASYNLVDGGEFDEDAAANGTIVDPVYIGVVAGASTTTTDPATVGGTLANTGVSTYLVTALAGLLIASAGLIWHKGFKIRKPVSFR